MLKRVLRKCLIVAAGLGVLWFGAALVMVFWPEPRFAHPYSDQCWLTAKRAATRNTRRNTSEFFWELCGHITFTSR